MPVERYGVKKSADTRVEILLASGVTEAAHDRALQPGEFRRFEQFGQYCIRWEPKNGHRSGDEDEAAAAPESSSNEGWAKLGKWYHFFVIGEFACLCRSWPRPKESGLQASPPIAERCEKCSAALVKRKGRGPDAVENIQRFFGRDVPSKPQAAPAPVAPPADSGLPDAASWPEDDPEGFLLAVAKACLQEKEGKYDAASALMLERILACDSWEWIEEAVCRAATRPYLNLARDGGRSIPARPQAVPRPDPRPAERAHRAAERRLLDMRLSTGKVLRDATRTDLESERLRSESTAAAFTLRARWFSAMAGRLAKNQTVGDALTEDEVRKLKEQHSGD